MIVAPLVSRVETYLADIYIAATTPGKSFGDGCHIAGPRDSVPEYPRGSALARRAPLDSEYRLCDSCR